MSMVEPSDKLMSWLFRDYGLPIIKWMHPRDEFVPNDTDPAIVAYVARVGLELGTDVLKVKYTGSVNSFRRAVRMDGLAKVACTGKLGTDTETFLQQARDVLAAGAYGVTVGMDVWQSDHPERVAQSPGKLLFGKPTEGKAMEVLS